MKTIQQRGAEIVEEYRLEYAVLDTRGAAYSFPCNADGAVALGELSPQALENFRRCLRGEGVGPAHVLDFSRTVPVPEARRCDCGGDAYLSRTCGVFVCEICGAHDGLVRCFCGWSASGGDGRRELVEMGENVDEDY